VINEGQEEVNTIRQLRKSQAQLLPLTTHVNDYTQIVILKLSMILNPDEAI
jgi:hypothetical protein